MQNTMLARRSNAQGLSISSSTSMPAKKARKLRRRGLILGMAMKGLVLAGLMQAPALAVDWDAGSTTDFNWSTATNWAGDAEPTASDEAVFVSPIPNPGVLANPNIITLSAGELADKLTFADSYQLDGGDLTLGAVGIINVATGKTATINSGLGGASVILSKSGAGTLVLGGSNTFAGQVAISNGVLSFSSSSNLGNAAATNFLNISNGATLKLASGFVNLGSTRTLTIGAGGAVVDVDNFAELTLAGAVTGSTANLAKEGGGRLVMQADSGTPWTNSAIAINNGALQITNLKALGANSNAVTVNTGGTLELNPAATGTLDYNVTLNGGTLSNLMNLAGSNVALAAGRTLNVTADSTVDVVSALLNGKIQLPGGTLTGTGKLTKNGGGTFLLQGANPGFSGNWQINAGYVESQNTTALGSGSITLNGGELINTGASANIPTNALTAISGALSANSGNNSTWQGSIDVQGSLTILGRDFNGTTTGRTFTVSGPISGAGNIDIRGVTGTTTGGVVVLSGTNTSYTGKITVYDTATLRLTSSDAVGATSQGIELINTVVVGGSGATLDLNSSAGITVSDPLTMNSSGPSPDNRSALKSTGPNTYAGPITMQGTGLNQIQSDSGTLRVTGSVSGPSFAGTMFLRGAGTGGFIGAGGININTGTVNKTDNSTWTILPGPAPHVWGNTQVSVGTLAMGGNDVLPATTIVTMGQTDGSGPVLNLQGFNQTVAAIVLNGSATGGTKTITSGPNATLTLNPASTLGYSSSASTTAALTGQGLGVTKIGSSVHVLGGNGINYQGPTNINGGILSIANAPNFVSNVYNNSSLALDGTTLWTFNGKVMSGTGTVQKDGTGTAVIGNPMLHTGQTIAAVGALEMGNPTGILVSSPLVLNGGVIQSAGIYNPTLGTSAGQLGFAGSGGFAARVNDLTVNVGGATPAATLTWGTTPNFIAGGQTLVFGSALSDRTVIFRNPIALDANRTIQAVGPLHNVSGNLTGAISDGAAASGLTKTGSGILMLSGNNTYSGGTTVSEGVLRVSNSNALGSGPLLINGGVLDVESDLSRDLGPGNGQIQILGTTSGLGGGGLRGPVTVTLNPGSGNNVQWGTADFDPTNLVLGSAGSNQPLTLASNIDLNNATRTVQVDGAGNVPAAIISGLISNSGAAGQLKKTGAGILALTGGNTFAGGISIDAGTLQLASTSPIGAGTLTFNGGALRWAPGATADLSSKFATVASGKQAILDTNGNNVTLATVISGAGGLNKTGLGTLTLNVAETYSGGTTVNRGTLALDFNAASAPASNILASGSTLALGGGTLSVLGKAAATSAQTLGAVTLTPGQSAISGTIGTGGTVNVTLGAFTRSVGSGVVFTKPATGNIITSQALTNGALGGWALFGNTDFATTSSSNVAALGATTALPAATGAAATNYVSTANTTLTAAVAANTIRMSGNSITLNLSTFALNITAGGGILYTGNSGQTFNISGTGILGAGAANEFMVSVPNAGATLNVTAPVIGAGAGSLTKFGAGDLRLGAQSSYTGRTFINGGRILMADQNRLGTNSAADAITLNGGGIMNLDSNLVVSKGITLLANGGTLTGGWGVGHANNRTVTISGVISGVGGLTIGGDTTPAPYTLSAVNTYQGGTTIGNGTGSNGGAVLVVNNDNNLGATFGTLAFNTGQLWAGTSFNSARAINMVGSGTVDTRGNDVTLGGSISGAGALTKTGNGILTLTAPSTFTGNLVAGSSATGTRSIIDLRHSEAAGTSAKSVTATNRNNEIRLNGDIATPAPVKFVLSNDGQWTYGTPDIASVGLGDATVAVRNTSGNNTINGAIELTSGGGATTIFSDAGNLTLAGQISSLSSLRNLILGGTSTGVISGNLVNGAGTVGVVKVGPGTWTLSGSGNTHTGDTNVQAGTLALDYTTNLTSKINGTLTLSGGTLSLLGNASPFTQTVTSTTINPGASAIALDSGAASLSLGLITRNVGGTVNFANAGTGTISTSSPALGGWATYGNDFAVVSGGNVVAQTTYALKSDAATWATAEDVTNTDGVTGFTGTTASGLSINSLRFGAAAANTVTIGDTLTVASGGILVSSTVGANVPVIAGGTLRGAAGQDLVVIQNNVSNYMQITSMIADNGGPTAFTKSGAGTLALWGANTYSGTTYINEGILAAAFDTSLGTGDLAINDATLRMGFSTTKSLAITGDAIIDAQDTSAILGTIADGGANTGRLIKTGTGSLRLGNYNTYRGRTLVNQGTLIVGGSTSVGAPPSGALPDDVIVADGASMQFSGDLTLGNNNAGIRVGAATGSSSVTLTVTGNNIASVGPISQYADASVSFTKAGTGILALSGANTLSGPITVSEGALNLRNAGALGTAPTVAIASGAALETQGGLTFAGDRHIDAVGSGIAGTGALRNISGNNQLNGAILLGGDTAIKSDSGQFILPGIVAGINTNLTLGGNSVDTGNLWNGTVQSRLTSTVSLGSGKIIKNDPGYWTLYGENMGTTGGVDVNAGFLAIRQQNALGTGAVNVAAGAHLYFQPNGMTVPNNVTLNGMSPFLALAGVTDSGTVASTLAGTLTLNATSNVGTWWSDKTLTLAGKVTGPGGLVIHRLLTGNNAPVVVLGNATNDYAGQTTVRDSARLNISSDANLGSTPMVNLRGGGILGITANMTGTKPIDLGFVATGDNNASGGFVDVATGVTATWNGAISGSQGGLNKAGAGTLILSGSNSLSAPIIVSGGTLGFTDLSNLGSGPIFLNGGRLRWETGNSTDISGREVAVAGNGGFDANGQTLTFAGNLTAFSKVGTGTITVTGNVNTVNDILIDEGTAEFAGNAVINGYYLGVGKVVTATPVLNIRDNATVNLATNFWIGDQNPKPGVVNQSGGSVYVGQQIRIGHWPSETSTYTLSGGRLITTAAAPTTNPAGSAEQNGALYVGIDGIGILNQSGGEITTSGLVLDNRGNSTGTDTYSLTGGTINLGRWGIQTNGTNTTVAIELGGGIVRATENWNQAVTRPIALTGSGGNVTFDTIGNVILNGALSGTGAFNKTGPGSLKLNSAANTFSGTSIQATNGTLEVDFANATTPTTPLIPASVSLTLSGTSLVARAKNNAASTQTFAFTSIEQGASSISAIATGTGAMNLNLATIFRNGLGSTVAFTLPAAGAIGTTSAVLGGWATVGDDFATVSAGSIAPLGTYALKSDVSTWLPTEDVTNSDALTGFIGTTPASASVNSIRFGAAASNTVTIADTLTVDSGGVLVASAVGANSSTITGGQLRGAPGSDLIVTQRNTTSPLVINSIIADNGGPTALTKGGPGTLALGGINTYSGKTYVNAGVVQVTADNQLGAATGPGSIIVNNGTLQAAASFELSSMRGIAVGAPAGSGSGSIDVTTANTLTYKGIIADNAISGAAGSLVKTGAGTLALEGANTYTGSTTINQGTLRLLAAAAIPAAGSRTVVLNSQPADAGVLDLNGQNLTLAALTGDGTSASFGRVANNAPATTSTLTLAADGVISTYSGLIVDNTGTGGTVALTKSGTGTAVLNAPAFTSALAANRSTYTGVTTVSSGTLQATWVDHGGLGSSIGAAPAAAPGIVLDGGTLSINPAGAVSSDRLFTVSPNGGTLASDSGTAANTVMLLNTGDIGMSGSGNRTLTLSGTNAGSGVGVAANYSTLSARIVDPASGTTRLTKTGAGAWTLTNANTYTGGTEVVQGTLRLNSAVGPAIPGDITFRPTALGSALIETYADNQLASNANLTFNLSNAGTGNWGYLKLMGRSQTVASLTSLLGRGVIENTEAETHLANTVGTLTINGNTDSIFSGYIRNNAGAGSGLLAVVKDGSGTLRLIGNQITYTGGTTIRAGVVALDPFTHTFTGAVAFSAGSTGTFRAGDNEITLTGLSTDATTPGTAIVENGSDTSRTLAINMGAAVSNAYAGTLRDNSGAALGRLSLRKTGAGSLILAGTNNYTGGTVVDNGTLSFASAPPVTGQLRATGTGYVGANSAAWGANVSNFINKFDKPGTDGYIGIESSTADAIDLTGFNRTARLTTTSTANLTGAITPQNGTWRFGGGTGVLSVGSVLADDGVNVRGVDMSVAGTTSLTGANSYTGPTNVSGGSLRVDADALPAASLLTLTGGVLELDLGAGGSFTRSLGVTAGQVVWNSGGFAAFGNDQTVNLGGAGATITYGAANGFAAPTGTFVFGSTTADAKVTLVNPLALGGDRTFTVNDGPAAVEAELAGTISGGNIIKTGAGSLTLSGNNTNTGSLVINGGTVNISSAANLGTGAASLVTFTGNGTLHVTDNIDLTATATARLFISNGASNGTIDVDAGKVFNILGSGTNPGVACYVNSATVGYTKAGGGTWMIGSQNNQFDGNLTMLGGTVALQHQSAIGDGTAAAQTADVLFNAPGTTLILRQDADTNFFAEPVVNNSATITLDRITSGPSVSHGLNQLAAARAQLVVGNATSPVTLSVITGPNVTTSSTLTTAALRVNQPNVTLDIDEKATVNVDGAYGRPVTKAGDGTLRITNSTGLSALTVAGGSVRLSTGSSHPIANNANVEYAVTSDVVSTSAISGTGSLTKSGTGTLTLAGGNSYGGGTSITGGTLKLASGTVTKPANPTAYYSFDAGTVSNQVVTNLGTNAAKKGILYGGAGVTTGSGGLTGEAMTIAGNESVMLIDPHNTRGVDISTAGTGGNWTASAWFRDAFTTAENGTGWRTLFRGNSADHGIILENNSNRLGTYVGNFDAATNGYNMDGLLGDGWHQITAVGNTTGNTTSFYVDGVLVGVANDRSNTDIFSVGNIHNITQAGDQPFARKIDEVYVYNSALSADDVLALYRATASSATSNFIPDTSAVSISPGATLDLNDQNEVVGSIAGDGGINLGAGTLIHGGDNTSTTYAGVISGTGSTVKKGTGTTTFSGTSAYSGATNVESGTLKVTGSVLSSSGVNVTAGATFAVGANQAVKDVTLAGATNAWTARVDLLDNDLVITTGNVANVLNQVKQGRNAGAWNAAGGITTSLATSVTGLAAMRNSDDGVNAIFTSFDGFSVDKDSILIKYTYNGDADLSGSIDIDDYFLIDTNYALGTVNPTYHQGDFNYSGTITADDYFLIDAAFLGQTGPLSGSAPVAPAAPSAAVPEPGTLSLLAIGAAALLGRRRRK